MALDHLYEQSQVNETDEDEKCVHFGFPVVLHFMQDTMNHELQCWAVEFSNTGMKILSSTNVLIQKDVCIDLTSILKENISLKADVYSCKKILNDTFEIGLRFQ